MATRTRSVMTVGRATVIVGAMIVISGLWIMASEPWGLDLWELFPFMAPGALLGLGTGWMSHAMTPDKWTWKAGRNAAIIGALTLPPIITIALAILGAHPERVLTSTVRAAWLAFIGGAIWAVGMWLLHRIERRST